MVNQLKHFTTGVLKISKNEENKSSSINLTFSCSKQRDNIAACISYMRRQYRFCGYKKIWNKNLVRSLVPHLTDCKVMRVKLYLTIISLLILFGISLQFSQLQRKSQPLAAINFITIRQVPTYQSFGNQSWSNYKTENMQEPTTKAGFHSRNKGGERSTEKSFNSNRNLKKTFKTSLFSKLVLVGN